MARLARVTAAGFPPPIIQRSSLRQEVFFCEKDYQTYIDLLTTWRSHYGVAMWAYCLMPNHVHLIALPEAVERLTPAINEAPRRYSRRINIREGWRSNLWQGRFAAFPIDDGPIGEAPSPVL